MNFFKFAHFLLANVTEAEKTFEPAVAALGERYRCQYLFAGMKHVADFVLLDRKLIIELDGKSHNAPAQKYKDALHEVQLKKAGYRVVRFSNEEAVADPAGTVARALVMETPALEELEAKLACLPKPAPRARKSKKPRA